MQQIPGKTWNIRAMTTKLGNSTGKVSPHVDLCACHGVPKKGFAA